MKLIAGSGLPARRVVIPGAGAPPTGLAEAKYDVEGPVELRITPPLAPFSAIPIVGNIWNGAGRMRVVVQYGVAGLVREEEHEVPYMGLVVRRVCSWLRVSAQVTTAFDANNSPVPIAASVMPSTMTAPSTYQWARGAPLAGLATVTFQLPPYAVAVSGYASLGATYSYVDPSNLQLVAITIAANNALIRLPVPLSATVVRVNNPNAGQLFFAIGAECNT